MQILIESHNVAWALEFTRVSQDLKTILASVPILNIEHVGSTSIPDLVAKPVLDIIIPVTEANVSAASDALVKAGYAARGEQGIPLRYLFRQPGYVPGDDVKGAKVRGEMKRG